MKTNGINYVYLELDWPWPLTNTLCLGYKRQWSALIAQENVFHLRILFSLDFLTRVRIHCIWMRWMFGCLWIRESMENWNILIYYCWFESCEWVERQVRFCAEFLKKLLWSVRERNRILLLFFHIFDDFFCGFSSFQ